MNEHRPADQEELHKLIDPQPRQSSPLKPNSTQSKKSCWLEKSILISLSLFLTLSLFNLFDDFLVALSIVGTTKEDSTTPLAKITLLFDFCLSIAGILTTGYTYQAIKAKPPKLSFRRGELNWMYLGYFFVWMVSKVFNIFSLSKDKNSFLSLWSNGLRMVTRLSIKEMLVFYLIEGLVLFLIFFAVNVFLNIQRLEEEGTSVEDKTDLA